MLNYNLRILVVLPMYGGSLPIGRYCVKALKSLGHNVRVFEASLLYSAFTNLKQLDLAPEQITNLENSFLKVISQAIWMQVQSMQPHLVLALAQAPLSVPLLKRLRGADIKTAMWFVEDYQIFQYWKTYAPFYDVFAVIQKQNFFDELAHVGQKNVLYLPLAALPEFHRPLTLSPEEKRLYSSDLVFLGAGYPNRRRAFRPLADYNFAIWGSDWEGETLLAKNIKRNGERISEEESVKIYNAAKINLNLHSSLNAYNLVSGGDFVNPRTFELAAMQAFQLVDQRSLLADLFHSDELVTFTTMEECYQQIDYFLEHSGEREQFAQKARKHVLQEHTYDKRMQLLLSYIQDTLHWQPIEQTIYQNNLTQQDSSNAIDIEIQKLFQELGLGAKVSFAETLARLRKRSGNLSELETSLLFLDELRKQYTEQR